MLIDRSRKMDVGGWVVNVNLDLNLNPNLNPNPNVNGNGNNLEVSGER